MTEDEITRLQQRFRCPVTPRTGAEYRRIARWWELEALRGYPSSSASLRYARNMRWAAELAGLYGPGTWLELLDRSGHPNPEPVRADRKLDLSRVALGRHHDCDCSSCLPPTY